VYFFESIEQSKIIDAENNKTGYVREPKAVLIEVLIMPREVQYIFYQVSTVLLVWIPFVIFRSGKNDEKDLYKMRAFLDENKLLKC